MPYKKSILITILLIPTILFFCWYIPVSFSNVFSCDDFWFGTFVKNLGFWGTQTHFYANWEGSYTHTFLCSFPHVLNTIRAPFICNLIALTIFIYSIFYCFQKFFHKNKVESLIGSLFFCSLIYFFTIGNSEIRYWVCVNLAYITEVSLTILIISLYHSIQKLNAKQFVFFLILSFLVGGSKITFISIAFSGMIINDILLPKHFNKQNILLYICLAFFVCINISAPGNYIRLEDEIIGKDPSTQMSVLAVILFRVKTILPVFATSLFLLPLSIYYKIQFNLNRKRFFICIAVAFIAYLIESIFMQICFRDAGPKRVYISAEIYISLFMLYIISNLYCKYAKHIRAFIGAAVLTSVLLATYNLRTFQYISPSLKFARLSNERDKFVGNCTEDTIVIDELPDSYLLLSYFCNDSSWLEDVYLPYFDKKNSKVVVRENHSK